MRVAIAFARWFLVPGCAAFLLLAMPQTAAAAVERITDQGIEDAIRDEFSFDLEVPRSKIFVESNDGIVTLTGRVSNILARERALRIAETVRGVRSVINRIEVKPLVPRSDGALETDVENALLANAATESWEIGTEVDGGEVTLTGEVESYQEKFLAGKVAKSVRGVLGVQNDIEVSFAEERTDSDIENDVEERLRWDVAIEDSLITVDVNDATVELGGSVGSAAEKHRATVLAWVQGVKAVDASDLTVAEMAEDERQRSAKYVDRTDAEVAEAVHEALGYDPRVDSTDVDVSADNGVVTLRGQVDNLEARRAAIRDAQNTTGVWRVKDRLTFSFTEIPDNEKLKEKVRSAMDRDPYLENYEITPAVDHGTVDLYGVVDSYFEKAQADDVVSRLRGVIEVDNHLEVRDPLAPLAYDPYADEGVVLYDYDWYDFGREYTFKSDWEIHEDIESEFMWSPFVDGDDVNVTVDNGIATLSGTVATWSERMSAEENALEGGAIAVDNDLKVEHGHAYYQP